MQQQDWEPVILRKRHTKVSRTGSAERSVQGTDTETVRKFDAGANRQAASDHCHLSKLDRDPEAAPPATVSLSLAKTIQKARVAHGWTQKDLALKINKPANLVTRYENGDAIPEQSVLNGMENALQVHLRGPKMGMTKG